MSNIDWQQVVKDLTNSGMTQAEIAEQCNLSQAAIQYLGSGETKEPKHSTGERLLFLLAKKSAPKQKTPSVS